MSQLSNDQVRLIVEASLLARFYAATVVSEFEAETLREISQRFVDQRRNAVVTDAEWRVVEDSFQALRRAQVAQIASRVSEVSEAGVRIVEAMRPVMNSLNSALPRLAATYWGVRR